MLDFLANLENGYYVSLYYRKYLIKKIIGLSLIIGGVILYEKHN